MHRMLIALTLVTAAVAFAEEKKPELALVCAYDHAETVTPRTPAVLEKLKNGKTVALYTENQLTMLRLDEKGILRSLTAASTDTEGVTLFAMYIGKMGETAADDRQYIFAMGAMVYDPAKDMTGLHFQQDRAGTHSLASPPEGYSAEQLATAYTGIFRQLFESMQVNDVWNALQLSMDNAKAKGDALRKKQEQEAKESTEGALEALKSGKEFIDAEQKRIEEEGKLLEKIFEDMFKDQPGEEN